MEFKDEGDPSKLLHRWAASNLATATRDRVTNDGIPATAAHLVKRYRHEAPMYAAGTWLVYPHWFNIDANATFMTVGAHLELFAHVIELSKVELFNESRTPIRLPKASEMDFGDSTRFLILTASGKGGIYLHRHRDNLIYKPIWDRYVWALQMDLLKDTTKTTEEAEHLLDFFHESFPEDGYIVKGPGLP